MKYTLLFLVLASSVSLDAATVLPMSASAALPTHHLMPPEPIATRMPAYMQPNACPKVLDWDKFTTDDTILAAAKKNFNQVTQGLVYNCNKIAAGAISTDARLPIGVPSGEILMIPGVRTVNVYECNAAKLDGTSIKLYFKISYFQPISDGSEASEKVAATDAQAPGADCGFKIKKQAYVETSLIVNQ